MSMITNKIILNERQYAEDLISKRTLGNSNVSKAHALTYIAKLFISNGLSDKEVEKQLQDFIFTCNNQTNIFDWQSRIDTAIQRAKRFPLCEAYAIPITQKELDVIASIPLDKNKRHKAGINKRKYLFTILCYAKNSNMRNKDNNDWATKEKYSTTCNRANIGNDNARNCRISRYLEDMGFLSPATSISNTNVRVNFVDSEGDPVFYITDFRNLGYQYEKYINPGGFYVCEICGITDKRSCNRQKTCANCCKKPKKKRVTTNAKYNRTDAQNSRDNTRRI